MPILTEKERADLLASVEALVRRAVKDARIPMGDRDDAEQECRLEVWKASARYDPAVAEFTTFATSVIRRKLADLRRAADGQSVTLVTSGCGFIDPPDPASERDDDTPTEPAPSPLAAYIDSPLIQ